MSDSISAYYDEMAEKEAHEQAEREKTVEYWHQRCMTAERELQALRDAIRVIKGV